MKTRALETTLKIALDTFPVVLLNGASHSGQFPPSITLKKHP